MGLSEDIVMLTTYLKGGWLVDIKVYVFIFPIYSTHWINCFADILCKKNTKILEQCAKNLINLDLSGGGGG